MYNYLIFIFYMRSNEPLLWLFIYYIFFWLLLFRRCRVDAVDLRKLGLIPPKIMIKNKMRCLRVFAHGRLGAINLVCSQ